MSRTFPRPTLARILILLALSVPLSGFSETTLLHRYSFTADVSDSVGTAPGTLQSGAVISGGAVSLNGSGAYVDLPNGIISSLTNATFEVWLTDNGSGNWSRIFDFGFSTAGEGSASTGTNYLFLTPQSGGGILRAGIVANSASEQQVDCSSRLPVGTEKHVVLTIDGIAQIGRLYVDGALVGENLGLTLNPSQLGNTYNNWLGRSQFSGDAYLNAGIDEFRIYSGALTAAQIQESYAAGPNSTPFDGPANIVTHPQSQVVTELQPVTFGVEARGTPPLSYQWRRSGLDVPNATNSTYTIASTSLSDSNVVFSVVVSNTYASTLYSVQSSNAVLTVKPDTNRPVLVRAESLFPTEVRVTFSEGVRADTATNKANYSITSTSGSLPISAARYGDTTAIIILTATTQFSGTNYTLTVNNVRDLAAAGNLIATNSQTNFIATSFVSTDIGNPTLTGTFTPVPEGYNLLASGRGINSTSDQFMFASQNFTNDFDVEVRVASLNFANAWTRAGLMARDGFAPNAMFAASFATPGPAGCHFESRTSVGANTAIAGTFPVNYPDTWLRLRRIGNVFDGFASLDGNKWEYLGSSTITMSNVVQVGFAVTSANASSTTVAQFRDFAGGGGMIATNAPLPFEPLGPSSRRTALVISEIMYNPQDSWGGTNNLEFIELWNSGLITEDLTGHKLTGEIDFAFPNGTQLAPGQFLVVAKDPAAAQSFYGVSCLGPYSGKLANSGGTLRLRNELGGILLQVEYDNKSPWPVAADGTGHSLVLSRPSYGENDPRAWSASDAIGGSPGTFEHYGNEPARGVVINEFLAHTDLPQVDYIELFNTSTQAVDLSGAWLSDLAGTNQFRIAEGTTIAARGFLAFTDSQLGFSLSADGEAIYLVNSNQTRVLDAVKFDGQENGVSLGRYPNGAPGFQRLLTVTLGTSNTPPRLSPVVINEIMYHPISDDNNDHYVEIYNRSGGVVNIGGWKLQGGISYTFPSNTVISTGGYIVVAENRTNLLAKYSQLNATNTFGDFSGKLSRSGERLVLAMPDDLISTNIHGVVVTNIFFIPVNEVTYADGGRWGKWSDGGGSSLELIDPDADTRLAANWADSNESSKAAWTSIDLTEVLENGQSSINEGTGGLGVANRIELYLQGDGEALVDDLQFLNNGGANLVANGDFTSGTNGWTLGGVLRNSFAEAGVGTSGSTALHLKSTGRGDTGPNKVFRALSATATTGAPNTGTIRAQVRWLKGSPYILIRPRGNWMEVSQRLNIPSNLGTPGLPNSRLIANAGPAISDVSHTPVLPAANQPVVVSTRPNDPDGISTLTLRYRIDPSAGYALLGMNDNGLNGDAVANDGIYSATIPPQPSGTLVAFYISANDSLSATTRFPADTARECHIRWGESVFAGSIGAYRLWVTSSNVNFWAAREKNANDPIDATFVYGNSRVVYSVDTLYSGSPFHAPNYDSPIGSFACDYEINFPSDDKFLGSEPFVLTAYDVVSGNFFFNDDSGQVDLTGNWIARKLGQQYNYRRHVHVVVDGLHRGTIYDDAQQPNGEMVEEYFPNDENSQLRKIESWFEFADDGVNQGSVYTTITRYNKSNGAIDPKRYRHNWRPRATENPNDWAPFTNLIAAVNNTTAPNYVDLVRTWMDVPKFLGPIIAHHICGSWDSYDYERGKNMFAYKPDNEPWQLQMWDIELSLGAGGNGATDSIYNMFDTTLKNMITGVPAFNRIYLRGFEEAINSTLMPGVADVALDERYAAFQQNGVPLISPSFIKSWISSRRAYLLTVIPTAPFNISNSGYQVVTGSNTITLTGTGPLSVENILVNSNAYAVTWTSLTNWRVSVPLVAGTNLLSVAATDRFGNSISNATGNVTVNYTGSTVAPEGFVVFNEVLYQSAAPGGAFVELFNTHSNYTFDLSGWSVNGLDYTFPAGATIPPRGYLVLAEDPFTFNQTYGGTNIAFDKFNGSLDQDGETLTLFRPSGGTNLVVVDRIRYESTAPWPVATNGTSLQLVDATQDNSRVANWATQMPSTNIFNPTPQWIYVTQTATLPSSSARIYIYTTGAGDIYLDDMMLVTGSVPGSGANILNNGNFESALSGTWSISTDFASSALSTAFKRSGNSSLHLVATAAGSGNGDSIQQNFATSLSAGGTYSLSFWYLQNTTGTPLIVRLNNSGIFTNVNPLLPASSTNILLGATPGTANSVATNLPPFPPLWLNELQANNITGPQDNFGQRDPWAEIFNGGATNLILTNYFLTDTYTNLTKWPFPTNATVSSNSFRLVWCDNQTNQSATNVLHAAFALASGSGSLALTRIINSTTQVVDYLNYTNLSANWSYGDVPDGQPFYRREMFYVTPGATNNGASAPLTVFINEWLADNTTILADPADSQYEDWFELYNPGTNAVDVGGYYLTDNLTNRFQFQIPDNGHYIIPAGGYLLVWADNESGQNSTNRADLHVDFALGKGGEAIGLFAADGTTIDAVTFAAQTSNVSEGRFPNGSANIYSMPTPTPRAANIVPNTAPILAAITNRTVTIGQTVTFTASASDSDLPAQSLTFSLSNAPAGAQIGPSSGVFTWTPNAAPATNTLGVIVTDNGTPNLSALQTFTVIVAPLPVVSGVSINGNQLVLSWNSFSGQKFQVEYKTNLTDAAWLPLGGTLTGNSSTQSFTNTIGNDPQRFYRITVLNVNH